MSNNQNYIDMKAFYSQLFLLLIFNFVKAQNLALPFFDDFEEPISNDATFTNWTTENLEGWNFWHIIDVGDQFMRFGNTDIDQNDWLITKAINCAGAENLKVNFSHFFHANRIPPRLYYTNQYNGDASQSVWTELSYTFGANVDQWYPSEDFIINNPGNVIYFAFHYQALANEGAYFLLDNFSVKRYTPNAETVLVGSSTHFEYYTNLSGQEGYYLGIKDELEKRYLKYISIWDRPKGVPIFPSGEKIKIKYISRDEILSMANIRDWECGFANYTTGEIFISPLQSENQINYYKDLKSLTVNEFAQLALLRYRLGQIEEWYLHGFGLYEMGYLPDRQQLLDKLSQMGTTEPALSLLFDIDDLPEPGNKDLMASFFQSKFLIQSYFFGFWSDDLYKWWQLLKHYYIKDTDRIQLIYSSDHFDYYAAGKELPYLEPMATNMEQQLALQESRFGLLMKHRVNICIYDNEVGKEINNRTDFQGLASGADKINSMPLHDTNHYGLINHEFMHSWVNMMSPIQFISSTQMIPGQFLNEGLAESTGRFMLDEEMPSHRYKIQDLYYFYQRKYNREPTWMEIVDNAEVNEADGFWVDAYALGEMYWRYMNDKYPDNFWSKVRQFIQGGRDWTVFGGKTADVEGAEFMQFMKELAFVGPPLESYSIPFTENFRNEFTGWTTIRFGANDHWQISDNTGYDDSFCAFAVDPYWLEEKDVDSWLVSPPLNTTNLSELEISFMYKQFGNGIKPEIFYTGDFSGPTHTTNWIQIENIQWNAPEGNWLKMKFPITSPTGKIFIAFRFQSIEGNYASYCIDNFTVKTASSFERPTIISSNPTSITQTFAMLNGEVTSDGGAAITQRGFYWSSTNTSPNTGDHVEIVSGTTGSFSKVLENLTPGTIYYFRAFATNSEGTAIGEVKQFTTLAALDTITLPFSDDFEETIGATGIFNNWTIESLEGWQYWHIIPGQYMRFENNDLDQNDWLITKPINCAGAENLKVNFSYLYSANKVPPHFYYTNQYNGIASQSTWTELSFSFGANENQWYSSDDIIVENPGDAIYFAFQYQVKANAGANFLLDNFEVNGIFTGLENIESANATFRVYPNPVTANSLVSFQTKTNEKVNLSLYDHQGRKICTLLNKKLNAGTYTIQLGNQLKASGVYTCKLTTSEGISTLKLVVNSN